MVRRLAAWSCVASVAIGLSGPALAAESGCLPSGEVADAVATRRVIAPGQVVTLARRAVPNADILRARLCRDQEALVYRVTALRQDGRLVKVTVDAPSGRVKAVH